jgi:hypothetical protein
MKPLATRLIKKQIQKALADAIRTGFEYIDGQLVGVRDRMAEAKASDEGSRREVLAEVGFFHIIFICRDTDSGMTLAVQAQEGRCVVGGVEHGEQFAVQGRG